LPEAVAVAVVAVEGAGDAVADSDELVQTVVGVGEDAIIYQVAVVIMDDRCAVQSEQLVGGVIGSGFIHAWLYFQYPVPGRVIFVTVDIAATFVGAGEAVKGVIGVSDDKPALSAAEGACFDGANTAAGIIIFIHIAANRTGDVVVGQAEQVAGGVVGQGGGDVVGQGNLYRATNIIIGVSRFLASPIRHFDELVGFVVRILYFFALVGVDETGAVAGVVVAIADGFAVGVGDGNRPSQNIQFVIGEPFGIRHPRAAAGRIIQEVNPPVRRHNLLQLSQFIVAVTDLGSVCFAPAGEQAAQIILVLHGAVERIGGADHTAETIIGVGYHLPHVITQDGGPRQGIIGELGEVAQGVLAADAANVSSLLSKPFE